ncbi:hypothetical protein [Campylobacter sp.]|uniref:CiaD-like domain-containing protein n=1 Tax=Campylobacter sp. TaxID=205 RepID=UPI00259C9A66|nr:hypothetical protein [Campylobacter sp.]MBQ3167346.1 hypothetical protein [Campylobacter sp.]
MKLEDIAKFTIDEVNAQLQGTSDAVAKNGFIVEEANEYMPNDFAKKEPAKSEFELVKEPTIQINQAPIRQTPEPVKQNNATQIKEILAAKVASIDNMDKTNDEHIGSSEMLYLQGLKERIGVLFEGLNSADESNSEFRLDMTIKFLEFALASIENRLSNLSK